MNPLKAWQVYRKANRVVDLLKEANVDKSLFKSKVFWFNILTGAAELTQVVSGLNVIPPGYLSMAASLINIGLRLVTDEPVRLPGTGGTIRKFVLPFVLLGAGVGLALAQGQATTKDHFEWDIEGPSLVAVQGYAYTLELDGTMVQGPAGTICVGTSSPFQCKTPVPALTPGTHVVRVKATEIVDGVGIDSDWSEAFTFTFRAAPATPGKPRIVRVPVP